MGSSAGMCNSNFSGLRVANQPLYIPSHVKNGQTIGAQLKFRAFVNHPRGKKASDIFDFTAWGKLADSLAKSLMKGKELHCECEPESYYGKVRNDKKEYIMNSDGTALTVLKTGFRITKPRLSDSTQKQIDAEIASGYRPANWNDNGAGAADWKAIRETALAKPYDGGDTFGYAKVYKVDGTNGTATVAAATKEAYGDMAENIKKVQSGAINPFVTA